MRRTSLPVARSISETSLLDQLEAHKVFSSGERSKTFVHVPPVLKTRRTFRVAGSSSYTEAVSIWLTYNLVPARLNTISTDPYLPSMTWSSFVPVVGSNTSMPWPASSETHSSLPSGRRRPVLAGART